VSRNEQTPEGLAVASGADDHSAKRSVFASEDTPPTPAGRGLSLDEQETSIVVVRAEGVVRLYSTWPAHVRALRADDRFREVSSDAVSAWFEIPIKDWHPVRGARRRRQSVQVSTDGV